IQPAPEWYGMRRPPFAVSPYPVGQPAALQGDGACVPFDSSCSPRSGSPLSNTSDLDEARPERLRVNSYAFSRGRSAQQSVPSRPVNVQDRAHSVPLAERDHRARVIYDQVSSRNAEVHSPSRPHAPDSEELRHTVSDRQLSRYLSAPELPSPWQVAEELGQAGGMAAPRYLLVRLGECIPAETGAATVPRSRLDCGPQWRDFLNFAEYANPEGVSLQEVLTCPCCLSIFRQPIGLPCGHSLCRGCYVRVFSQSTNSRKCPLCRTDLPRCDLRVNVAMAAVSDALRSFLAVQRPNPRTA
ncbi:Tripartite motif-containing protein 5 (RING-type E3 ubiquitin transferase TRIM5) (TRIM5alpha), partial [Durusdinium trenchii]